VKKILIVDDSETIRQQIGRALGGAGFTVVEATDGIDGLDRVDSHRDLSLIILDVNMPRLNGLDMLDRLSSEARTNVPVLILTTEAQQALIDRARKAGAKGWIIKPVKLDLLVQAVTKLAS
jgi:two-component system, chemotaxis family, chemotaxis protein CheY